MASNKDILEAQRYNRRRLVNAFVAGTPNGRELASRAPARPLLIGTALALVLVVVAMAMGRLSSALPTGWENNKIVVVKGSGTRYVTINGILRPLTNMTSGLLLANRAEFKLLEVDPATLNGIPRGSVVGLPDAPDYIPAASFLKSGDWVSCSVNAEGARTWVAGAPANLSPYGSAIVADATSRYLIADGHRHRLSGDVAFALKLDSAAVHPVTGGWLNLFEEGTELRPLTLRNAGQPASGMPARLSNAVIGSRIDVHQGSDIRRYVVSGPGQLTPLTDLTDGLYTLGSGRQFPNPINADVADVASLSVVTEGIIPADWPAQIGATIDAGHQACARLVETAQGPTTELTQLANPTPALTPGVTVAGGSGALVRTSAGGSLGALRLVSDNGHSYGLGGNAQDTLTRLGYANQDVHAVPQPWLDLVPAGSELSTEAAWKTVTQP